MHRKLLNRWKLVCCVALLAVVMAGSSRGQPAVPEGPKALPGQPEGPAASDATAPVEAAQLFTRFVPIASDGTIPSTVFGVEMTAARRDRGLDNVAQLGPAWVRRNGLLWKDVEPLEGRGYAWSAPTVAALEAELIAISERGLQPVLVVRGHPRWASQTDCAPINPAKYGRYAAFLAEAVKRYSLPPYNVKYWELGNEPDAPTSADNVYGCWGDPDDPYFGGRAYGNMLKAVYPGIKAANPGVQVLNGSLLLDRPNTPIAKFMEGVFAAGARSSFDILGFHAYCMFDSARPDGHDARYESCADDWKIEFLRNLTRRYGVPDKPLMRTETALLCSVAHQACRQQQADYIPRHYARSVRDGLLGTIWFILDSDGFRNSALVDPDDPRQARPAFLAMQHAAAMFGAASYSGPLTGQHAGVEGFHFRRNGETITVVWSNTPHSANIPVSEDASVTCSDRDGRPLACRNSGGIVVLSVSSSPSYVVGR